MSVEREEVFDARRLAPVEWEVAAPARVSVTLATKADACPRDAGMYLRYGGGAQSGPLLRGTLAHAFAERMMTALMMHGEPSLYALQPGEDPVAAAAEVSQTTREWVNELVEELDLAVCGADVDDVREMAYHIAVGLDVDPESVIAVERKFVLETSEGLLSGKVDLASLPHDGVLQVDDYKSAFYVPPEEDVQRMFQTPLYAALILWGRPVEKVPCETCEGTGVVYEQHEFASEELGCQDCGARGTVEVLGEPLGLDNQWVRCRQLYPRFLKCGSCGSKMTRKGCVGCGSYGPGRLASRGEDKLWGRADLRGVIEDAERAMRRIKRGVETRQWPAVDGKHCSMCTAKRECPLPSQLRRFAGGIETREQAAEAMEWVQRQGDLVSATRAEIVALVKAREEWEGELPVGNRVFSLQVSHGVEIKKSKGRSDWDGLGEAIEAAAEEGAPFDKNDWLKSRTKTEFKPKKEEAA